MLFFRAVGDIPNLGVTALEAGAEAAEAGAASGLDACSTSPLRASAGMQRFKAFVLQALRCVLPAASRAPPFALVIRIGELLLIRWIWVAVAERWMPFLGVM